MNLILRTSGGQGIRLEGKLDVSDLPEDLAERVEEVLTSERLTEAQRVAANTRMVDAQLYELTLLSAGPEAEAMKFEFSEAQDIPEVLDVLDELMQEIIRRKLERRKKRNADDETSC